MGNADELLPIRRILVDGKHQKFIRDLDFSSALVQVTTTLVKNSKGVLEGVAAIALNAEGVRAAAEPAVVASPTGPLTLTDRRVTTYAGPAAAVLARSASGHQVGAELTILFPAASATSLRLSPDLNVTGDCTIDPDTYEVLDWDSAAAHVLSLAQLTSTLTVGTLRTLAAPDVTAPTVASVTAVDANPNAITVGFSKPVYLSALTGLSLTFSVGTARTITAIESGNGTDAVTLTLSGNLDGSEAFSLVVGSGRVAADYSGNLVATSTTAATLIFGPQSLAECAAWTEAWELGVDMAPSTGLPAPFTSWDSVTSALDLVPPGTAPSRTTTGLLFSEGGAERVRCAATPVTSTDFALFGRVKGEGGWIPFGFDTNGGANRFAYVIINGGSVVFTVNDGTTEHTVTDVVNIDNDGLWHVILLERSGSTLRMQIDNRAAVTATSALTLTALSNLSVGALNAGGSPYNPGDGTVSDVGFKANASFTTQERASIIAYLGAR